jgi:hypothetical protein
MKNVFIAIGGSGTKVAEALVKMIGLGFPTRFEQNGKYLTSYGNTLDIWRIDPDRSAGAADDLKKTLTDYANLQTISESRWSAEIQTDITNTELDPLNLTKSDTETTLIKNLRLLLASQETALPFLHPFYEEKDLDVDVSEGFYQKPFIGSAVMALFAETLELSTTEQGRLAQLMAYDNEETNFFLCGSLHGGTGASGVPIMAKFLKDRCQVKNITSWRIGGCLLGPYFLPPAPPFKADENDYITKSNLEKKTDDYLKRYGDKEEFKNLDDEAKRKLFKLILQGYYAKPEEVVRRARQGLEYYRTNSDTYFDLLYLVSKPSPNTLPSDSWSNGGLSQKNPLNSAEVVAALAALDFFSQTTAAGNVKNEYKVPGGMVELDSSALQLGNLPCYKIGDQLVVPEKVFFVSSLLCYLLEHVLPWPVAKEARGRFEFFDALNERGLDFASEETNYRQLNRLIGNFLTDLTQQHTREHPTGWGDNGGEIEKFFKQTFKKILFFGSREIYPVTLGSWKINEKIFQDFEKWSPNGNFPRGEYLRLIWSELYKNCEVIRGNN